MALTAIGPALLVDRSNGRLTRAAAPGVGSGIGFAPLLQGFGLLRRQPYLRGLAGLVLISTMALTLADYVFKSTVAAHVAPHRLGTFLATFYLVLNLVALAVQLFVMGWTLRALGLHRALWALPLLLLAGASGMVLGGGLLAALLLKGADGSLRHSLHRTSTELLFVPLPDSLRARAKPLIDVLGQRGGQAVASLLILSQAGLGRGDVFLAAAAGALCVAWVAWASDLKQHYLELFRTALREGMLSHGAEMPELDLGSLEALFLALNSPDDHEVLGAMDLLVAEGRGRVIPALILYHPSAVVVIRALELFARAERTDFVPIAARLRTTVGIFSYHGGMTFGINSDYDTVPDVEVLTSGIEDSLAELVRAAQPSGKVSRARSKKAVAAGG
jgi:hypothetical protein